MVYTLKDAEILSVREKIMIRRATIEDLEVLASIIRGSFRDVAERFSLTQDNCPKHPSNCTTSWVESDMARGVQYFILSQNENPIGCVGLERPSIDVFYLERLCVLPEMRGKNFGGSLVRHALSYATSKGARKVSIGIIAEQTELKEWYKTFGFVEMEIKRFAHLPFQVCFMEFDISLILKG
jgi:N-acetylglutamate synthase-like GNAT family acetyltransferase